MCSRLRAPSMLEDVALYCDVTLNVTGCCRHCCEPIEVCRDLWIEKSANVSPSDRTSSIGLN